MGWFIKILKERVTREFAALIAIIYFCQSINILLATAMHDTLVSVIGLSTMHFMVDELGLIAALASSVAAWLIVRKRTAEEYNAPIAIWFVLNFLTFGWIVSLTLLHSTMIASVFALVLVLCTIDTMVVFHRLSKCAGRLMAPFLIWSLSILIITSLAFF